VFHSNDTLSHHLFALLEFLELREVVRAPSHILKSLRSFFFTKIIYFSDSLFAQKVPMVLRAVEFFFRLPLAKGGGAKPRPTVGNASKREGFRKLDTSLPNGEPFMAENKESNFNLYVLANILGFFP